MIAMVSSKITAITISILRGANLCVKFAINLYIAKYLSANDLGVFGFLLTLSMSVHAVAGFGLMTTVSRTFFTEDIEETGAKIVSYVTLVSAVYVLAWSIIATTAPFGLDAARAAVVLAIIFFEHLNNELYSFLLNVRKVLAANVMHFVRSALWAMVFIPLSYLWPRFCNLETLFTLWLVSTFASFLFTLVTLRDWPWRRIVSRFLRNPLIIIKQLRPSTYIYLSAVIDTVNKHVDKYIITMVLGLEVVGVYIFYWQIGTAISNLTNASIIQPTRAHVIALFPRPIPLEFLKRVHAQALGYAGTIALILAWPIHWVTGQLSNASIATHYNLYFFVAAIALIQIASEIVLLCVFAQRADKNLFGLNATMAVASAVLGYGFAVLFGIWGATTALLVLATARYLGAWYGFDRSNRAARLAVESTRSETDAAEEEDRAPR